MYIEVTVDLCNYIDDKLDLRLSDYHTVKKLVDIAWKQKQLDINIREGTWVRVVNKNNIIPGHHRLVDVGIMTGDRIEVL
ncbi:EsaB/YukD family protein [Metabacillus litoralis]|uniref:EsaB/YukD family protein n=1 Tax=Metabacillus litoralis TaxID=152268 RepID=UPI000EF5D16D|nr:EsaB/YukD family protein [Metabacillus litoralis]